MPQMMPINWIMSLFFFICIFLMFNMLNYYIFNYSLKNKMNNQLNNDLKKNFYWKW